MRYWIILLAILFGMLHMATIPEGNYNYDENNIVVRKADNLGGIEPLRGGLIH